MTTPIKLSGITIVLATLLSSPLLAKPHATLTDFDGDGVISADEIKQAREARRAAAIIEFDTDGNGKLSREERKVMKQSRRAARIAEHDTDGDGALSDSERQVAKAARRAAIEQQLDVNGDGEVSAIERAGFEEVKAARGDKKRGKGHKHGKNKKRDDGQSDNSQG